jgi:polyisoprenoid-binding protein YceI
MTAGIVASVPSPALQVFLLDPARSRVLVHVGKSGLFSFAGHTHEVAAPVRAGRVVYDAGDPARSSVVVEFDAAALRVTGRGEPAEDVPEVQRTMLGPRVLDVERFPRIAFESRRISVTAASGDRLSLRIAGELTLHGVTRPAAAVVEAQVGAEEIAARGRLTVKQTDFGIRPVTAGAGTVRVKDALDIEFSLLARRTPE